MSGPQPVAQPADTRWAPSPGCASGIGSWPGTDPLEAARVVFGELAEPGVPFLPELPGRGPGAEMLGRAAALLVDLAVDLQPSGWRLVDRPGRDLARARSWWRHDLDALAEVGDGYTGPLKLAVTGPWTLATGLWLPRLERALVDPGACRDLVASLAEGVAGLVRDVRRLVPGARVLVQLDEPSLTAVLGGMLPTASGFGRLRAVEPTVVEVGLRAVVEAAAGAGAESVIAHCCAGDAPVALLARCGADAVSLDVALLDVAGWEAVAAAVERGTRLWAGLDVARAERPRAGAAPATASAGADAVWLPWRRLGLPVAGAAEVVLTPSCGLAGLTPAAARRTLARVRDAAAELAERAR